MRYLLAVIGLGLGFSAINGTAAAEPVTIYEAIKELRDRGIQHVDGVTVLGEPLISGQIEGQGFNLKLTNCDTSEYACTVSTFSSCKTVATFSRAQTLELTNTYNNKDDPRGAMYIDDKNSMGSTVCIKTRRVLQEEDKFNMADVFEWQLTLRDFLEYVESEETANTVRSIMGASR